MLRLILQATEATKPMGLSSGTSLDKSSTTQLGPEHVGLAQAAIRLRMAAQPGPRHSGLSQPAQPKPNTAHLGHKLAAGSSQATGPSVTAALKVCIHYTIPASYAWQPWLNITAGCSVFR